MKYIDALRMVKQATMQKRAEDAGIGTWEANGADYLHPRSYIGSLGVGYKSLVDSRSFMNAHKALNDIKEEVPMNRTGVISKNQLETIRNKQSGYNSSRLFPTFSKPQEVLQQGLRTWGSKVNYPEYLRNGRTSIINEEDMKGTQPSQILGPDFMRLYWKSDPTDQRRMLWMLNNQANNKTNKNEVVG